MRPMAGCFQNLMLGELGSHSALSVLVGALFKKYVLSLNMPCICLQEKYVMKTALEFWDIVYYIHLHLICMLDYVHNSHSVYSVFLRTWSAEGMVCDEI
jgi:hypothetical protein